MYKRASKDKNRALRITTLAQMFRLLEMFSESKNSVAPTLYKNISHALIENHEDVSSREYVMANLSSIYLKHPSIPIGFVLEPMLKQIQLQETPTYNSSDFEFFVNMSKHPKLQPDHALHVIDTMAKIYLNDLIYANCAAKPFKVIAKRFIGYKPVYDFVIKYMTMTFSMLPRLESKKKAEEK